MYFYAVTLPNIIDSSFNILVTELFIRKFIHLVEIY